MASHKESPRQKMIGMMYLVLTALLALNVSDQVLKGFITVDESIDKSKQIITDNNKNIEAAFAAYIAQGNVEAKPYYEKCLDAKSKIERMVGYIDTMKYILISKTEKTTKPDTAQLRFMKKLDDFDTPTQLFIGSDETNPTTTKYSAYDLKQNLNNLYDQLNEMIHDLNTKKQLDEADGKSLIETAKTIRPIDRNLMNDGLKMNWELENFYNIPTAAVITNFDKIQTDLKNVESELFRVLAASSNKYLFKTNKLQAKVFAPSAYVLAGETFKADIHLSTLNNALNPDRMKVMIGAEYDSVSHKIISPGTTVAVNEGIGKYEVNANTQGQQNLKGVIEYRNPKGTIDYYPFDYSYMVAAPFSAVGADNMNVMYVGVDNPITASAAGFSPTDLTIKVSGCGASIKQSASGKYIINASSTGTCYLTVSAKTKDGIKQQGPPKAFRVKAIPPPVAKINGKPVLSTLEYKLSDLNTFNSLGAICLGFEFPLKAVIKEATITGYNRNGELQSEVIKSPILTEKAKTIIRGTGVGKRVFIEGIKVSLNGQMTTAPDVIIKRKG